MRFLIVLILNILATALLLHFLPWWTTMIFAFLTIFMLPLKKVSAFLATGIGNGLCWIGIAAMKDFENGHLLSKKVAELMNFPSFLLLLLISGIIGFVTGGLGGFAAANLRSIFVTDEEL